MKKRIFLLLPLILWLAACGDDHAPDERMQQRAARFEGTDMPDDLPWTGGRYRVRVRYEPQTRGVVQDRPWSVRLVVDDRVQGAVRCDDRPDTVVRVPANATEKARTVAIELCGDGTTWIEAARARQQAGLIHVAGTWWTRGNLALEIPDMQGQAYRFVVAQRPEASGLYFDHSSTWGVRSDEPVYSDVAYNPEPHPAPLGELPAGDGDPCGLVGDGALRTPTYGELYALFALRDPQPSSVGGMAGLGFDGGRLFLPFAGACDRAGGTVAFQGTNGGYWGLGADHTGAGAVLFLTTGYAGLDYGSGASLASVRCVKHTRTPRYVSHAPDMALSGAAVRLTVLTDPGDAERYPVRLIPSRGSAMETQATARQPQVAFDLPANDDPEPVVYRLLVDGADTGREFVQGGHPGYALYVSHAPLRAGYEAFILTVTCRSDLGSFPVRISAEDGLEQTVYASAAYPVATFSVPENGSSGPRTLVIRVNGRDTGVRLVQQARPAAQEQLSVVWSRGYLTAADGAYTFAGERERGLYFKFGSRYGMTLDTPEPASDSRYSGTSYAPEPERRGYAEIPAGEVDPCSLVAPAGTWRMPSVEEWEELLGFAFDLQAGAYRCYTDGEQRVFLTPSGSLREDGAGVLGISFVRVWSSTPEDEGVYFTLSGGLWSSSSVFSTTVGANADAAMMVRCVRSR